MIEASAGRPDSLKKPGEKKARPVGKAARTLGYPKRALDILNRIAFPILILITWFAATALKVFPPMLIPSPQSVYDNFLWQTRTGLLQSDLAVSVVRVLKGYGFGVFFGLAVGILMGVSAGVNKFFSGILNGIRQIPPIAWIPLFVLWFGIGDTSKIVLIAKGTFFPVLLNTIDGIRNTPTGILELSKLYQIKKRDLLLKVYLPSSAPFVFVGLRLGAGMAWMSVVAAEMLASSEGIGFRINDAQQLMKPDEMFVDMLVIGVIGGVVDMLLKLLTNFVSRWKEV